MITIEWDSKKLEMTLSGAILALQDLRPVWRTVDDIFRGFMQAVFDAEGDYEEGGKKWADLNPAYAARKRRQWGTKPILQASGRMIESFTQFENADHVYRIGPTFGEFGSRVEYANYHQYGTNRPMPARPIIRPFTTAEGNRVVGAMEEYIFRRMRQAL